MNKHRYFLTFTSLVLTLCMFFAAILPSAALTEQQLAAYDINGDGKLNISDVTVLLSVLSGTESAVGNPDVNDDKKVNINDVTALLEILAGKTDEPAPQSLTDLLDNAATGVEGTSYKDWTYTSTQTGVSYAGQSAGGYETIQIRSKNSNSGIVVTGSELYALSVTVVFNENTADGRVLEVYGKNTPYSSAEDLYNADLQGEKLGAITCGESVSLTLTGEYKYIGLRSADGAIYLEEIDIEWSEDGTEPVEPTETPVEPTETPVEPTETPIEPTETPIEPGETVTERVVRENTGVEGTTYKDWTYTSTQTGVSYAGQSAGGNDSIQIRSKNSNSGIVVTGSKLYALSVTVVFNENTADGRVLEVYGKNTSYSSAEDLYNADLQGEKLGVITYGESVSLTLTGEYKYIGLRSADGAIYLEEIDIEWSEDGTEPIEPTETPVEPTETPVEPTETPVEPTETPIEPTETPVEPTETPIEPGETVTERVVREHTGVEGSRYADWTYVSTVSGVSYAGQSAGGNDSIQIRSNNNNSGVIVTDSNLFCTNISVVFNENTVADRVLNIYGSDRPYTSPADLYDSAKCGTLLGTIKNGEGTSLKIKDEYKYIGVRSANNAIYLEAIVFTWSSSEPAIPTETPTETPVEPTETPVEPTETPSDDPSELDTPEKIVNAAYDLKSGEFLINEQTSFLLTGVVSEINTAYSDRYHNITITIIVAGLTEKPIQCYRLANAGDIESGKGVEIIRVGDTVTVEGKLTNYKGTVEFAAACRLTMLEHHAAATVVEQHVTYETLDELAARLDITNGIHSTGDVEVLVIPIGFTNSPEYKNVKQTIETAMNGSNEETGWRSLAGYYREVSFGALNLHGTVTDIYQTGKAYDLKKGEVGVDDFTYLEAALKYFDGHYDYSKFDKNNDGYIDCIYLVYLAPYGTDDKDSELWWAYTNEFTEDDEAEELRLDGIGADWYMWFSFEFFSEPILTYYDDNDQMITDDKGVSVNAETVIHESGHALGLDDYYDYVNRQYGGLGGLNMMDCNQGDHDPFSKAILGWIHPTVLKSGSYETTLSSFTSTGDALFLSRSGDDSFFGEYFIISLYTPDGVNAIKAEDEVGLPAQAGVVIYHVNAAIKDDTSESQLYDIYKTNNGRKTDRLIKIVEADNDNSIDDYYYFCVDDMFLEGSSVTLKWNDGTFSGWTVSFGAVTAEGAVVSVVG